jgi:hypothetical protein
VGIFSGECAVGQQRGEESSPAGVERGQRVLEGGARVEGGTGEADGRAEEAVELGGLERWVGDAVERVYVCERKEFLVLAMLFLGGVQNKETVLLHLGHMGIAGIFDNSKWVLRNCIHMRMRLLYILWVMTELSLPSSPRRLKAQ